MRIIKTTLLAAMLAASPAMAQQPAAKTTEQQARSYIASAFITGAAPLLISEDVVVQPELRAKLALPTDANSRVVYQALVNLTNGRPVQVRPAIRDEVLKSQVLAGPGKPVFALEAGATTLVLQYDLERDNVSFVGQPMAIAAAAPAAEPQALQKMIDTPPAAPAEAQAPAAPVPAELPAVSTDSQPPAPAASAPAAAPDMTPSPAAATAAVADPAPVPAPAPLAVPEAPKPGLQLVEPQTPRIAPVEAPATKSASAAPAAATLVRARIPMAMPPLPQPNGACVIKPVMSDQDLVNCGATPRY
ncbi:MAG: hypothetical protein ABR570_00640 [Burkholderiales bacterium]